jgi:transposase-like protein
VPSRRTRTTAAISDDAIRQAFDDHGSISAVAGALGVSRNRVIAEGQRLGLRDLSPNIPDDVAEQYRQERSLAKLAKHYGTSAPTVSRWLSALGIPREPPGGRQRE